MLRIRRGRSLVENSLEKTPMELTNTIGGGTVDGELSARSTKLRTPCMSTSNDESDMLKSTFQAVIGFGVSANHDMARQAPTVEDDVRHGASDIL